MEIEVQDSRDNPLLGREEFHVTIDHAGEATPSKDDVLKLFAAENDLDLEKLEVDGIYTGFGGGRSEADIKAYEEKVREITEEPEEAEEETEEEPEQEAEEVDEAEQEAEEESEQDEEEGQEAEAAEEEGGESEAEDVEEEEQTDDEADEEKEE